MKRIQRILAILIIFLVCLCFADIRVGIVRHMTCPDTAGNTVLAITEMLESHPNLDLIIATDGALAGTQNRARLIFGRDEFENIIFAEADTSEISWEIACYLDEICSLAAIYSAIIIPGTLWEVDSSYRVFCSAPIIGPDGRIKRIRRKAHQDRCDIAIDSTIFLDTIVTRDSSTYSYFITITNESRDIPVIYESPLEPADIWLCLESHWFAIAGHAAAEFESDLYPDYYSIRESFNEDLFTDFYRDWLDYESPVFISEMSFFGGAFWMQNLADSLLPENHWFRMDYYEESLRYIIAGCNPHEPSLFSEIDKAPLPEKVGFHIYPNPFNSGVRCQVSGVGEQEIEIGIYDLRGNVVATPFNMQAQQGIAEGKESCAMKSTHWCPDESISSGIYLIRATTEDGFNETKRVFYLR